ncbi:MAG: chemotaxis protein CheB [Alphaproteobacteria bacterium]|nr:MAG: chemotaxis protein CheB [Alphaproteobacteria bacterium]
MSSSHSLPVVVIAGSVEGIGALLRLINTLPQKFPALAVAVVHGHADESLDQLVRMRSKRSDRLVPVLAVDGCKAVQGHIYIAPSACDLVFTAPGVLGLTPRLEIAITRQYSAADQLFASAAKLYGDRTIGVVLSGGGDDGTQGLKAITRAGGSRIVQTPAETLHPGMPSRALIGDHVQHTVMLDQMGQLLSRLVER